MRSANDSAVLKFPEREFVDVKGVRTAFHRTGEGEDTIVFIHGGNFGTAHSASSAAIWSPNMLPLAKDFKVVAIDKLGQGFTDPPTRDEDYTMAAVVAHLGDTIARLGLQHLHLVGHSRGGFAAARLALERPEFVRSLTIVSSGTLSPGVGTNEVTLALPPHPPYTREAARWVYERYSYGREVVTEDWLDQVMEVLALKSYRDGVKKFADQGLGMSLFIPDLARYKRQTLAMISEGRLQRPTQIIWGRNDPTVVPERGVEMFKMISAHERNTTLNIFNNCGHFVYREHPERFNALLSSFVSTYGVLGAGR